MTPVRPINPIRERSPVPPAPPDRGQLYYDDEIAAAFFKDLPGIDDKTGWVRRHLPKSNRIRIGKKSAWWQRDIEQWIADGMKKEAKVA